MTMTDTAKRKNAVLYENSPRVYRRQLVAFTVGMLGTAFTLLFFTPFLGSS